MADSLKSRVGEEFEVSLKGNPTTGYIWQAVIDSGPGGGSVLLLGTRWEGVKRNIAGAPTVQVFRFRSTAPGEAIIKFEYRRPWEKGKEASEQRVCHVTIE